MRVKHLDDLYTWKQIRKLQLIHMNSRYNGFVPIAICAPGGGYESRYSDYYEWYGKQGVYYARRLWESARVLLADVEAEALAFDIVEASECFNTIRFRNPSKVRDYCIEFKRLMMRLAAEGNIKCAIGRVPARPHPWDSKKRIEEVIIADDAEYRPFVGHDPKFDNSIPDYQESAALDWSAVEGYFVDLTEDELAFLNGEKFINKPPSSLDMELHEACGKLDMARVEALLDAGANPNSSDGDQYCDTLISRAIEGVCDLPPSDPRASNLYGIIDLLVSHGCDMDLSHYESAVPIYDAVNFSLECLEYLIQKGADPNAISWIGLEESPLSPLDSVADDICVYGENAELKEKFDLIDKAGGKFFSELVPDFYGGEA